MSKKSQTELIVAADVEDLQAARSLVDSIGNAADWFKVGSQLFTRCGPDAVRLFKDEGKRVFLDLKFHDIPNTVYQAVRSAAALGVDMTNVHASGGASMLHAAAKAAEECGVMAIAVTVLTSLDEEELQAAGIQGGPAEQVRRLACLARNAGLTGVVCSAQEIELVQRVCGSDFLLVVPGIRPAENRPDDQRRVLSAAEAAAAGADYIVVGRPITRSVNPGEAARAVQDEIEQSA